MQDLTQEEAGRWITAAPPLVQDAVVSPATQAALDQIGKQYGLHVDIMGILVKLTSYMLLGYAGPDVFLQELRAAGVSDQQAQQIIGEINKKIFIPLREKIKGDTVGIPQLSKSAMPQPRPQIAPQPVVNRGPSSYAPPLQSPKYFHLENKLSPPGSPPQKPTTVPPLAQRPVTTLPSVQASAPSLPKAAPSNQPSSTSGQPLIQQTNAPAPPPPAPGGAVTPLQQALRTVLPPANLPGAMPSSDMLPPSGPAPKAPLPPPKQYSADPYREPIE